MLKVFQVGQDRVFVFVWEVVVYSHTRLVELSQVSLHILTILNHKPTFHANFSKTTMKLPNVHRSVLGLDQPIIFFLLLLKDNNSPHFFDKKLHCLLFIRVVIRVQKHNYVTPKERFSQ